MCGIKRHNFWFCCIDFDIKLFLMSLTMFKESNSNSFKCISRETCLLPSLREQGAGSRHHEGQTLKGTKRTKLSFPPPWNTPENTQTPVVLSTYNTPTIITWIGPWRYVILCINLYFSSLCMMMGRMTGRQGGEGKKSQERKRITWRT